MLTLDLLRFRVSGDTVTPIYLDPRGKYLAAAERIVEAYSSCVGESACRLEEKLDEMAGSAPDYKVYRGLAKMMSGYATIEPPSELDAEALRMEVFEAAARDRPLVRTPDLVFTKSASQKLQSIAADKGIPVSKLETSLYADLKESQIIRSVDSSLTGAHLIDRYNTALAQAMLYRATRMIIDVGDGYRTVFKYIKLARLMHSIKPRETGYRIDIDGPLSLFSNVERYGIAMAKLLPAVLKCREWRLAAKVNVAGSEKLFRLSPRAGLKSHCRDEPVFDSAPEEAFFAKFARNTRSKWRIEREGTVLDLKETVLIPDFAFRHSDGRVVHLEIVGFWTPDYLARKIDKLSRVRDAAVVVAVPESLNCSAEQFAGTAIRYKSRLLVKDVLPALDAAAPPAERPARGKRKKNRG